MQNKFDLTKHDMTHDNVLVKSITPKSNSKSKLIDPAQYEDKSEWGVVISIGPGRYEDGARTPMSVKVGDTILYGKYSSYKTRIDGEDFLVIRDDDIISRHD